jgi:hypothetical protein
MAERFRRLSCGGAGETVEPGRFPDLRVTLLAAPSRKNQWRCCGFHHRSQLRDSEGFAPSSLLPCASASTCSIKLNCSEISSRAPEKCQSIPCLLGIDAGEGTIGATVISIKSTPFLDDQNLTTAGTGYTDIFWYNQ